MPWSPEQHNEYNRARWWRVRAQYQAEMGGKCVQCSSITDLQFDHRDPSTKEFDVSSRILDDPDRVRAELKKCQLLCGRCHIAKHATAKGTHGTLSSHRYCKCEGCKEAKNEYMRSYKREWRRKRRQQGLPI